MSDIVTGVTPAGFIPYSEERYNDFKARLAAELVKRGLDTSQLSSNPKMRDFIVNYGEQELRGSGKEEERLHEGISLRFANMEIRTSSGSKTFPVINEYHGHHLMRTRYFTANGTNVEIRVCEVIPKAIIVS